MLYETHDNYRRLPLETDAHCIVIGSDIMLQAGRPRFHFPMRLFNFALRSTEPLTEMSTGNLSGSKGRPTRKADLTAICEPIV
jgi:hypothetical protein